MRIVRRFLVLAVFVGAVVLAHKFVTLNSDPVTVSYVAGEFVEVPLWTVIVVSILVGGAAATGLSIFELAKQGLVARRYRKTAEGLESEIHHMRNLPLVGAAGQEAEPAPSSERGA